MNRLNIFLSRGRNNENVSFLDCGKHAVWEIEIERSEVKGEGCRCPSRLHWTALDLRPSPKNKPRISREGIQFALPVCA